MADASTADLLDVWVEDHLGLRKAGVLERFREDGRAYQARIAFHYADGLSDADAVSLTMPIRRASYEPKVAGMVGILPPIFDQNLPEGALHDYFVRRYLKIIPDMGDFELLHLVGNRAIGRVRVVPFGQTPNTDRPIVPALSEILATADSQQLLEDLFEKVAHHSGVSGVQPKILFDDPASDSALGAQKVSGWRRVTFSRDGYILKAAGRDYPGLALNEYLCLHASRLSGIPTAEAQVSDDGQILAIKRFDVDDSGNPIGFEDMASLSAVTARDKYKGSYEEMVQIMSMMVHPKDRRELLAGVFKSIALSCVIGNGDAHLKNFGLLYADPTSPAQLAPVSDVCTTVAYIKSDVLALSLGGAKQFPPRDALVKFGRIACKMTNKEVNDALAGIARGIELAAVLLNDYCQRYEKFSRECGQAMLKSWDAGVRHTLGLGRGYCLSAAAAKAGTEPEKHVTH